MDWLNSVTVSLPPTTSPTKTTDNKDLDADAASQSAATGTAVTPGVDRVTISGEGREKLEQEGSKALHALASKPQEEAVADTDDKSDRLDKMIEDLKEKIREVQQEIAKLQGKEDEASIEQRKMLENQLNAYLGQLMALNEQKLEQAKQQQ